MIVVSGLVLVAVVAFVGAARSDAPQRFCRPALSLDDHGRPLPDDEQPFTRCLRAGESQQHEADRRRMVLLGIGGTSALAAAATWAFRSGDREPVVATLRGGWRTLRARFDSERNERREMRASNRSGHR